MSVDYSYRKVEHKRPRKKVSKTFVCLLGLIAVNIAVIVYHGDPRTRLPIKNPSPKNDHGSASQRELPEAPEFTLDPAFAEPAPEAAERVETVGLKRGQTVAQALSKAGVSNSEVNACLQSLKQFVDFRKMRPGHTLKARFDGQGTLLSLDVLRGPIEQVRTCNQAGVWQAQKLEVRVDTTVAVVRGVVRSSLWDGIVDAGEDPRLALELADIFAWDLDFYSQVYPGDSFRVLVEKRYAEGRFIDYGRVFAAEYKSDGFAHHAFLHAGKDGVASYYDAEGNSLRKQLLKAPLKYAHMTSGFGSRVHPVLGYTRAHNGVDYGVPTGTPVWSVGDGRVIHAGWNGGAGKMVEIQHNNGWSSQYMHLSAIYVRVGQRVAQKDNVGAVGTTGMSTGPHLHYGLKRQGHYVDPSRQKFERGRSLTGAEQAQFKEMAARMLERWDETQVAKQPGVGVVPASTVQRVGSKTTEG